MKSFKKIMISFLTVLLTFFSCILIITIFNYYNLLNYKIINILKILIPIFSMFIGGYRIGKNTEKKGWLEGIKLSFLVSMLLLSVTLILNKFKIEYLLYLIIIIISSTLGSVIGINKK